MDWLFLLFFLEILFGKLPRRSLELLPRIFVWYVRITYVQSQCKCLFICSYVVAWNKKEPIMPNSRKTFTRMGKQCLLWTSYCWFAWLECSRNKVDLIYFYVTTVGFKSLFNFYPHPIIQQWMELIRRVHLFVSVMCMQDISFQMSFQELLKRWLSLLPFM